MDTPKTLPLDLLPRLLSPLCDNLGCGLFVVEILGDESGNPRGFVGRVANPLFCLLLSVGAEEILGKELPEALCQILALPDLLRELKRAETEVVIQRDLHLGPGQRCTLQARLPCPGLLTITIKNPQPTRTMVSSQAEIILASLGEPCVIIDRNFTVCYENETAKTLWGSNRGKNCYAMYHGRQSRCESCSAAEVFADGKIHKNEKLGCLNGREQYLEITSAPLRDAAGAVTAVVNITHDATIRKMTEKGKEHLLRELQASLTKTKRLNGLLSICCYCKKIKDDNGAWQQLESYLRSHAEVEFSHGICPECGEKQHPEIFN